MKKLIALILSALMIVSSAFICANAEDVPTQGVRLTKAEIVSVPLKNRVVVLNGAPETPEGIKVKLTYSDGSVKEAVVEKKESGYRAGDENVYPGENILLVQYGILNTNIYFDSQGDTIDEMIYASYRYLSLPSWLNIANLFGGVQVCSTSA